MTRVVSLAVALCLFVISAGQFAGQSRGQSIGILESSTAFLSLPQVQKELGLSASVAKSINTKLNGPVRAHMETLKKGGQKMSAEARLKAMRDLETKSNKARKESLALLNANQKARLRQIGIQQMGPGALVHPEIKKTLALNAAQSTAISEIVSDGTRKMYENFKGTPSPKNAEEAKKTFAQFAKAREASQKQMMASALKQLSAAQRAKFASLQGKPFKINVNALAGRV